MHGHQHEHGCCHGGRPERFLEPCLLLLLAQQPDHGYTLMERLGVYGFPAERPDPGTIYRMLRKLEQFGMIRSSWQEGASGPAKRVYEITEDGKSLLASWNDMLKRNVERVHQFLRDYEAFTVKEHTL